MLDNYIKLKSINSSLISNRRELKEVMLNFVESPLEDHHFCRNPGSVFKTPVCMIGEGSDAKIVDCKVPECREDFKCPIYAEVYKNTHTDCSDCYIQTDQGRFYEAVGPYTGKSIKVPCDSLDPDCTQCPNSLLVVKNKNTK